MRRHVWQIVCSIVWPDVQQEAPFEFLREVRWQLSFKVSSEGMPQATGEAREEVLRKLRVVN